MISLARSCRAIGPLTKLLSATILLTSTFALADHHVSCESGARTDFFDGFLSDKDNEDDALLVLIAGLGGDKTWKVFLGLLDCDNFFDRFDVVVYHTPKDLGLDEHVGRIKAIMGDHPGYSERVIIAHSMGGFVSKRFILDLAEGGAFRTDPPRILVTYGTPLDTSTFGGWFTQNAVRRVKGVVSPLRQEIFNNDVLDKINAEWKQQIVTLTENEFRYVGVFGIKDKTARADRETSSRNTIFIRGDHKSVMNDECSFEILKSILNNNALDARTLYCAQRATERNIL